MLDEPALASLTEAVRSRDPDVAAAAGSLAATLDAPLPVRTEMAAELLRRLYELTTDDPAGTSLLVAAHRLDPTDPEVEDVVAELAEDLDDVLSLDAVELLVTTKPLASLAALSPHLERALDGQGDAARACHLLARLPLEDMDLAVDDRADLSDAAMTVDDDDAAFWLSVALARVGVLGPLFTWLDRIADGDDPPLLWGSPFVAWAHLATVAPLPSPLYEHLALVATHGDVDAEADSGARRVRIVAGGLTGLLDAEGFPVDEPVRYLPPDAGAGVTEEVLHGWLAHLLVDDPTLDELLEDPALADVDAEQSATIVTAAVEAVLDSEGEPWQRGNDLLTLVAALPEPARLPVDLLLDAGVGDDELLDRRQVAWLLGRRPADELATAAVERLDADDPHAAELLVLAERAARMRHAPVVFVGDGDAVEVGLLPPPPAVDPRRVPGSDGRANRQQQQLAPPPPVPPPSPPGPDNPIMTSGGGSGPRTGPPMPGSAGPPVSPPVSPPVADDTSDELHVGSRGGRWSLPPLGRWFRRDSRGSEEEAAAPPDDHEAAAPPDWEQPTGSAPGDDHLTTAEPPSAPGTSPAWPIPPVVPAPPTTPPAQPPDTATRTAWPRIDAPDQVVPAKPFTVVVGLRGSRDRGLGGTGAITIPATATVTMTLELMLHGFAVYEGDRRITLVSSVADPHPTAEVQLVAVADEELLDQREIGVTFLVDGEMRGYASRRVRVRHPDDAVPTNMPATTVDDASPMVVTQEPTGGEDLAITVKRGDAVDRRTLVWSASSRLVDITLPDDPKAQRSVIDDDAETFLQEVVAKGSTTPDPLDLFTWMRGRGSLLRDKVPPFVLEALDAVTAATAPEPPAVLFATAEPNLPWELTLVDPPGATPDDVSPFLAARTRFGRWVLDAPRPPAQPPVSLQVRSTAVVRAVYDGVPEWSRLPSAEAEATTLVDLYPPARTVESRMRAVLNCLEESPGPSLLHFALHGKAEKDGLRRGLVLVDDHPTAAGEVVAQYLQAEHVRGVALDAHPFVFLNACQVGAGDSLLGSYAGIAAAFVTAGASAVVAPVWSVDDVAASGVALGLYASAFGDEGAERVDPAESLRRERATFTREAAEAESTRRTEAFASGMAPADVKALPLGTHLAYQFIGHPCFSMSRSTG